MEYKSGLAQAMALWKAYRKEVGVEGEEYLVGISEGKSPEELLKQIEELREVREVIRQQFNEKYGVALPFD